MDHKERYIVIAIFFMTGAFILIGNLFFLQVIDRENRSQARNSTLSKRSIRAERGIIYDRNGKRIVVNEPLYELEMVYNEIDENLDVNAFCSLLDITPEEYEKQFEAAMSKSYFRRSLPIRLLTNLEPRTFAIFQEHLHRFPGFYPVIKSKRAYPYPHAAHVMGFITEVSNEDLKAEDSPFEIGDYKGGSGIERIYDQTLRGHKGWEYVLKDNIGREVESFDNGRLDSMAIPGEDLVTTIDIELQSYGELLMTEKRGSVVAIEPESGDILAIISSPGYDPNLLALGKLRNQAYFELLTDTVNRPFFDRTIQAQYPPGSIFKPILSLIALQENSTYSNRYIPCDGEYVINRQRGFVQGCRDHPPPINLTTALQYSCNTYFFQVIREFIDQYGASNPSEGLSLLNRHLSLFGIGHPLGIDLLSENKGFMPSPGYYDDLYNTDEYSWRSTYVLSLGIGQGEMQLTTLQMANLAVILANRGFYYPPHLVKELSSDQRIPDYFRTKIMVDIDSLHFAPVLNGMERVVDSGTGIRAFVPGIRICGKTGTSQNPHGLDHSVFIGFAPRENPEIAIAVLVENAGSGSSVAAPIAGLMIENYLLGGIRNTRKPLEDYIINLDLINQP